MNRRVMIVDDSLTVRMDLAEAFRAAGFGVALCESVAEARRALASDPPALMVLDVVLPDGDGPTFLAELRAASGFQRLPVLLLSSEAEVRDRIRGLEHGADEYVGKPYDAEYVVARAAQLLHAREPSDTRLTVLVIDDSVTYREELGDRLTAAGYRAVLAGSPREGLRRAADLRPSAIIVDGVMPEMDGTTLVRHIRLDPGLSATPCLLLTASEGAASEVEALDSGADAFVRKGESTDVILARLAAVLRAAEDSRERPSASSMMGPKRILAVDDSDDFLDALVDQLRGEGYEVVKATSGQAALELLAVERVDCILLDFVMPGLSGVDTCRRIKGSPVLRNVPLVMMTGRDDPEAVVEGMNAGADDFVAKSVGADVIKARLRAQFRRKQFEDENRRVREEILRKDAEADAAREQAEARAALLRELERKNHDLHVLNKELEMFAYAVSHDLRQPLRAIDGFSQVLLEEHAGALDERGLHYLERVRAASQRMGQLIDGLLLLSRVTRKELTRAPVRLDATAARVIERLRAADPERNVGVHIEDCIEAIGDPQLVESIFENLLGNAWKFTAGRESARIEVGSDGAVYHVRDNGAGFPMEYAHKLFAPFQRLHSDKDFPGTGMGLATTQRIVHRHGGRIWAESEPDKGATFFFTLSADEKGRAK